MDRCEAVGPSAHAQPKIVMTRISKIKTFALYQSGTLCIIVTTLLVWPFLGRVLSQGELGRISLILAIASIAAPALAVGTHLYLANKISSGHSLCSPAEARTAVYLTSVLYLIGILASSGSYLVTEPGILLPAALSFATAAYLVTAGVMRGIDRPTVFALSVLAVQVLGLLGLGLAVSMTEDLRAGVSFYVAMIAVPVTLQFALLGDRQRTVPWILVLRTLAASSKLVPHLVLAVALLTMMRVLVALQLGDEAAANYTFAALIIGGSITIGASLDAHWSVRSQSASSDAALDSILRRNQIKTQVILLVASVAVACFLYIGLPIWLPRGYDSQGILLTVLCALPAASLQAIADGRAAVLMWKDRAGLVSASTALGTGVTILLSYLLLPIFGWQAIGFALTTGMALRTLSTALSVRLTTPASRIGRRNFIILAAQFAFSASLLLAFF